LDDVYKLKNEMIALKNISFKNQEIQEKLIVEERRKSMLPIQTDTELIFKEFERRFNEFSHSLTSKIKE
jgi:hypothetical protein